MQGWQLRNVAQPANGNIYKTLSIDYPKRNWSYQTEIVPPTYNTTNTHNELLSHQFICNVARTKIIEISLFSSVSVYT